MVAGPHCSHHTSIETAPDSIKTSQQSQPVLQTSERDGLSLQFMTLSLFKGGKAGTEAEIRLNVLRSVYSF